ncbi:uncharacterized protein LOC142537574 [Primulina tabacum]|uniref:uncharacterized protein LOC142537574 n=1 Tax=Primulina tabacum TaxID=48773 RepID=UPI003F59EB57
MGLDEQGIEVSWTVFKTFTEQFSPPSYYTEKENEYNSLRQGNMSVAEYASTFTVMLKYAPHVAANPKAKYNHFVNGLNNNIYTYVVSKLPTGFAEAVEREKNVEARLKKGSALFVPTCNRLTTHQNLKAKGKMFKKSGSVSSSSIGYRQQGESQITTYYGPYCNRCGGRHFSEQCVGVYGSCRECGQEGHYARVCPSKKNGPQPVRGGFRGGSSTGREDQAQEAPGSVRAGNCYLSGYPARVLFDTGASHSFISKSFITSHSLTPVVLPTSISVATPMGHVISRFGISVDPSKVEAMINWSRPTNVPEIRRFVDLAGYYRRFIEGFSKIAKPITRLTQKNVKFIWSDECESSFLELKKRLTTAPVLTLPSGSGGFIVCTDASLKGLGCVLMKHRNLFPTLLGN